MIELNGYRYYMHVTYRSNLDIILTEAIPNKWDSVIIVFGMEGAGKSTLVSQSCLYMDHNYGLKNVVFTPEQLDDTIENSKPEDSIHWDEAITGADASQHASKIQSALISKFTQIRKNKLKIFMCFPYLFMLRRYFLERCLGGIYVYAKDFNDRGHAKFYSQPQLLRLHYLMKEKYKHNPSEAIKVVRPDFFFHYPNVLCVPEKEYDLKKEQSRKAGENERDDKWKRRAFVTADLYKDAGGKMADLYDKWGIGKQYFYDEKRRLVSSHKV